MPTPTVRVPRLARTYAARREVGGGGRHIKTIDIHAHCVIPEAETLLGIRRTKSDSGGGSMRSAINACA